MTTLGDTFNLIDQPWIPVRSIDGRSREVSIGELFTEAPVIRAVGGDIPTQAFAIQRVLLAIVRRAIDWSEDPVRRWGELWRAGEFPRAEVESYLRTVHHRFDLLDTVAPFYQVADLQTAAGVFKPVDLLIADRPTGAKYFTTRAGAGAQRLSLAEAARWVVHCQAFDPSGIKTGDLRDPRTKDGKGYPIGIAWCGQLGGVLLEGSNLFETMMLNTVLRNTNGTATWPSDVPVWERTHPEVGERDDTAPLGPCDVLTWQSRRIKLQHDGKFVNGAIVGNGDRISPHNRQDIEFCTAWRHSEPQSKQFGETRYLPAQFDPDRSLWRGIEGLLADIPSQDGKPAPRLAPGVVNWIDYLVAEKLLDRSVRIRPHALALQYTNAWTPKPNGVVASIDDALQIKVALIGRRSQPRVFANRAVQAANDSATALANLAGNLAEAAGGNAQLRKATARAAAYFALDAPYRQWVADLDEDTDLEEHCAQWQRQVREIIGANGRDLISSAGKSAWKGRMLGQRLLDSSLASKYFWSALRSALPAAFDTEPPQEGEQQ
ncbi:CRISPR-associated protein, Cse1 family (plasmid) [Mycobacterium sp. JS623]|uniref:type I-E CRISPR-associated protein Cse1/CasA n=1 Tax=Mycobacterium sp. JS623 TaxID=212767 RepID=UPI0002A54C66|nr:type I-E CRISPR-associated protein Cse1/CasA [Mycobacterium sp. JS623]AGB27118.1 CRISPR-associated protein, Cse1 family [Mycobacterium sp. JS623]